MQVPGTTTATVRAPGARLHVERTGCWGSPASAAALTCSDEDVTAANPLAEPERVLARTNDTARLAGGRIRIELPPVSWTALSLA